MQCCLTRSAQWSPRSLSCCSRALCCRSFCSSSVSTLKRRRRRPEKNKKDIDPDMQNILDQRKKEDKFAYLDRISLEEASAVTTTAMLSLKNRMRDRNKGDKSVLKDPNCQFIIENFDMNGLETTLFNLGSSSLDKEVEPYRSLCMDDFICSAIVNQARYHQLDPDYDLHPSTEEECSNPDSNNTMISNDDSDPSLNLNLDSNSNDNNNNNHSNNKKRLKSTSSKWSPPTTTILVDAFDGSGKKRAKRVPNVMHVDLVDLGAGFDFRINRILERTPESHSRLDYLFQCGSLSLCSHEWETPECMTIRQKLLQNMENDVTLTAKNLNQKWLQKKFDRRLYIAKLEEDLDRRLHMQNIRDYAPKLRRVPGCINNFRDGRNEVAVVASPIIIVAEGLFCFLADWLVMDIISDLVAVFRSGASIDQLTKKNAISAETTVVSAGPGDRKRKRLRPMNELPSLDSRRVSNVYDGPTFEPLSRDRPTWLICDALKEENAKLLSHCDSLNLVVEDTVDLLKSPEVRSSLGIYPRLALVPYAGDKYSVNCIRIN